ncbi:MAG: hypothetical protein COB03_19230 [Alteromonas sp.]|nr:MAG: hypothetical protein COB03_19230 [Alteromonas sp.]
MSEAVNNILEKIPYFEGAFRRKVTSGAILSIALILSSGIYDELSLTGENNLSWSLLLIGFLVIFAIGNLIELISDVFVSNTIEYITKFRFMKKRKINSIEVEGFFDNDCIDYINTLPTVVIKSIKNPYGKTRDTAWYYFSTIGQKFEIELARKLRAKNQDVLVITTSIALSLLIVFIPIALEFIELAFGEFQQQQQQQQYVGAVGSIIEILAILFIVSIPLTFYKAYLISVKNSSLVLIEYKITSSFEKTHNKSLK